MSIAIRAAAAAACLALSALPATAQDDTFQPGLGTWQDRVLVEMTLQRYVAGFDSSDPDLFASAFADDGVFEYNEDVFAGRDEIAGFILRRLGGRPAGVVNRESRLYHVVTNSVIVFEDETHATHTAYGITIGRTLEETHISSSGSYTDELEKIDGEWLITRRVLDQLPVFNPNAAPAAP
jgi:uncharacterized protein (TIGR02246 family)